MNTGTEHTHKTTRAEILHKYIEDRSLKLLRELLAHITTDTLDLNNIWTERERERVCWVNAFMKTQCLKHLPSEHAQTWMIFQKIFKSGNAIATNIPNTKTDFIQLQTPARNNRQTHLYDSKWTIQAENDSLIYINAILGLMSDSCSSTQCPMRNLSCFSLFLQWYIS